jgi:putative alpha-1,2-mannosidase
MTKTITQSHSSNVTHYIDPFFGIYGGGNCLPGPYMPLGLLRPGPDTTAPHLTNGLAEGEPIVGFSQNHVSGTGGLGRTPRLDVLSVT